MLHKREALSFSLQLVCCCCCCCWPRLLTEGLCVATSGNIYVYYTYAAAHFGWRHAAQLKVTVLFEKRLLHRPIVVGSVRAEKPICPRQFKLEQRTLELSQTQALHCNADRDSREENFKAMPPNREVTKWEARNDRVQRRRGPSFIVFRSHLRRHNLAALAERLKIGVASSAHPPPITLPFPYRWQYQCSYQ